MKPSGKLLSLELGRFIAAMLIMLSHEVNYIRIDTQVSGAGFLQPLNIPQPPSVVYFFVLSGFVMMAVHGGQFGQRGAALNFFWRRACRIYPAYWVALILPFYLWYSLYPWTHLFNLVSLVPRQMDELDGTAWTLRYEMAFYVMFGLGLLPVVGRYILAAWVAGVLVLWLPPGLGIPTPHWLAVKVAQAAQGRTSQEFFYSLDELFLFGMLAGWLYRRVRLRVGMSWRLVLAGLAFLAGDGAFCHFGSSYGTAMAFVLGGAGFGALMLGLAGLEETGVLRLGRAARELGKLSYPLYVIHPQMILATFLIMARHPVRGAWGPACAFGMMLGLTVIASLALTYLFDQPVQKFLKGRGFAARLSQ